MNATREWLGERSIFKKTISELNSVTTSTTEYLIVSQQETSKR